MSRINFRLNRRKCLNHARVSMTVDSPPGRTSPSKSVWAPNPVDFWFELVSTPGCFQDSSHVPQKQSCKASIPIFVTSLPPPAIKTSISSYWYLQPWLFTQISPDTCAKNVRTIKGHFLTMASARLDHQILKIPELNKDTFSTQLYHKAASVGVATPLSRKIDNRQLASKFVS